MSVDQCISALRPTMLYKMLLNKKKKKKKMHGCITMGTCTHACMHTHILPPPHHTHIHPPVRTHTHTHTHTCTYTHPHIHTYTYIRNIMAYTYIHTYIHTYKHTYIHAYAHTQQGCQPSWISLQFPDFEKAIMSQF